MNNTIGIVLSFVFVLSIIAGAQLLLRYGRVGPSITRKLIHIGVAHWWFLAMYFFDSLAPALVGPISFTVINYISYRKRIFRAMEHEVRRKNLGTVYFPISLIVLVALSFGGWMPVHVAGMGILILGWGDGLASIVGERFGARSRWHSVSSKSLIGTATMFAASFLVVVAFELGFNAGDISLGLLIGAAAATAAVAALAELFTPFGLDNLSVPIVTALFYFGMFR